MILAALMSVGILVFSGLGIAVLFTPKDLKRYVFFMAPLAGYCFLVLMGWHCFRMDLQGTDAYAWSLLVPPSVFLAIAVFKLKREQAGRFEMFDSKLIAPVIVATAAFAVLSIPLLIKSHEGLTTISIINHDIVDNGAVAQFLKEHQSSDKKGFLGQTSYLLDASNNNRFGSPFVAAFMATLLSLEAYQMTSLIMNIFFFFGVLVFYVVAVEIFKYTHIAAVGITALFAFNPFVFYLVYAGFHGQVVSISLSLCFFLVNLIAVNKSDRLSDLYPYIFLAATVNWGLGLTYPHILPILYVPVFIYMTAVSVSKKCCSALLNCVLFVIFTLLVPALFSPYRAESILANFLLHANLDAGWNMPYISPAYIFGLFEVADLRVLKTGMPFFDLGYFTEGAFAFAVQTILTCVYFLLVFVGLLRVYKHERTVFLIAIVFIALSIIGYNYFYFGENLSPRYKSFKFLSYFLPFYLLSSLIVFRKLEIFKTTLKYLLVPVVLILFAGNSLSIASLTATSGMHRSVSKEMAQLKKAEAMIGIDSLNILNGYDWWEALWINAFLMEKEQHFNYSTYAGRNKSALIGQWDLINLNKEFRRVAAVVCKEEIIPINSIYALRKSQIPVKGENCDDKTKDR